MACDIPNRVSEFVWGDENAIALGEAGGSDDKLWQPTIRPFRFSHRAQKWKHSSRQRVQSLPVAVCCAIWFGDAHTGFNEMELSRRWRQRALLYSG